MSCLKQYGIWYVIRYMVELVAFQKGFSHEGDACQLGWKKVGAATKEGITQECLSNPNVLKSFLGVDDEEDELKKSIQNAYELAAQALAWAGYRSFTPNSD
jgi:hypothetical protein